MSIAASDLGEILNEPQSTALEIGVLEKRVHQIHDSRSDLSRVHNELGRPRSVGRKALESHASVDLQRGGTVLWVQLDDLDQGTNEIASEICW